MKIQSGKLKTFAIKPNAGYAVEDVEVNGQSVGVVSRYTVESTTDVTIVSNFQSLQA